MFIARPVLWKSQHLCKVGWFSQRVVKLGPCAFHPFGYKTQRFQNPPTHPQGLIQSFRESVQTSPGECGQRTTGLCPVDMEEGDSKRRKREVSWRKNLCRCPAALSPQTQPALTASLEALSWSSRGPWGCSNYGKAKALETQL